MTETIQDLPILLRREVEARLAAPLIEALCVEFGEARVLEVVQRVIVQIAHEQGAELAQAMGGCSLAHFIAALEAWKKGDAMQMEVLAQDETRFHFNATRCRYAEMYRAMGIPELGKILSCSRDYALIEGFNPGIQLQRTQTLLEGAPYCDFRYDEDLSLEDTPDQNA